VPKIVNVFRNNKLGPAGLEAVAPAIVLYNQVLERLDLRWVSVPLYCLEHFALDPALQCMLQYTNHAKEKARLCA
jgi:hypothetical protein